MGCAGRGIIVALEKLKALQALEEESEQIVLYDVFGDVVCGDFAVPIRGVHDRYLHRVFRRAYVALRGK